MEKYTVKNMNESVTISIEKTERAAVATGRKHEREISALGGCAEGFKVYENGRLIRVQICDNFGNHWKEA